MWRGMGGCHESLSASFLLSSAEKLPPHHSLPTAPNLNSQNAYTHSLVFFPSYRFYVIGSEEVWFVCIWTSLITRSCIYCDSNTSQFWEEIQQHMYLGWRDLCPNKSSNSHEECYSWMWSSKQFCSKWLNGCVAEENQIEVAAVGDVGLRDPNWC